MRSEGGVVRGTCEQAASVIDQAEGAQITLFGVVLAAFRQAGTSAQIGGSARVLPGIHITQRACGQGMGVPGSRTRVPGPSRQPEPLPLDETGLVPVPRSPAVSGHPAASPAVPEPALEPRRHQGIPAGATATLAP